MKTTLRRKKTDRIEILLKGIHTRGLKNRSDEWFKKEELPDIAALYPDEPVIIRRAHAIDAMLQAMTNKEISKHTLSFEIEEGDLLCGVLPMGSNGLGKVFPNYLTPDEIRIGSITNKSEMALLGHNTVNYTNLLNRGLKYVIEHCHSKINSKMPNPYSTIAFYKAVKISCEAVVSFANRWALKCEEEAENCPNKDRKEELLEMARISKKVPYHPAESIHEAIQSIWFFHLSLHASMNYMSLGRLDQVLNPFIEKENNKSFAQELIENFIIKAAWRLNLTTEYLVEQDHMDYNAALGVHAYYLDQRAGLNNFLQNIIIGGKKPDGSDATNSCTLMFLQAYENVNLSTPGIYVRLHKDSPKELITKVSQCLGTHNNLPNILNDEVLIPAMFKALCQGEDPNDKKRISTLRSLANDYCVDGCWEPILNGCSYWTFGMINGLTILECALNNGATLNPNPELLRGQKLSIMTGDVKSYDQLIEILNLQIQFFVDQSALPMYQYYLMNEFIVPSPLYSSQNDNCLESGLDITWGGAKYNIGGTILGGVPDMVNTLAAIRKWVKFENGPNASTAKYRIEDVNNAFKYNFVCGNDSDIKTQELYDEIKIDFRTNSPLFGNNDPVADDISKKVLDQFYDAVARSKKLGDKVFLDIPPKGEEKKIEALRFICGYYGEPFRKVLPDFDLKFTAGMGTFEQYNWQGASNSASASRESGAPLAPNFTPVSGTMDNGIANFFKSLSKMEMKRFAGGVISDVCLDEIYKDESIIEKLLKSFIENDGNMLTLTIGSHKVYQEIYELAHAATKIDDREFASKELGKYAHINVRVGGWQAPFITLPLVHMQNYVHRPSSFQKK